MGWSVAALDATAPAMLTAAMLEESPGVTPDNLLVCVGDNIAVEEENFLKGHGTVLIQDSEESQLVSSVCGAVKRVNKLVMMQPFKGRYSPELGDVVVGRVVEVQTRRWAIEMGAQTQTALQLSAVQLPGGAQRRRTADDELNMRQLFQEGDVIVAEVQNLGRSDGNVALHMRSSKYGKLQKGQLVCVPAKLVRRQASHIVDIEGQGVRVVMGCNGWIWVAVTDKSKPVPTRAAGMYGSAMDTGAEDVDFTPEQGQWALCARFAAAIRALARVSLPIQVSFLQAIVEESTKRGIACADMTQMEFLSVVLELELSRRAEASDRMQTD